MNQYQWTFLDNAKRRHTLGIAHSPTSGHLVVHCDQRIVTIDFSVLEPKSFSFFIDDELCKLDIEGSVEEGFTYKFNIDFEVDTEVNRERKIKRLSSQRRDYIRFGVILGVLVLVLGGIGWWGFSTTQDALPTRLLNEGLMAQATIRPNGELEFIAEGNVVNAQALGDDPARLARLGFISGDRIPVLYKNGSARKLVVDWRSIFKNIEDAESIPSPASLSLAEGLAEVLPQGAGAPFCAIRAAGRLGGFYNQMALLDAYALQSPKLLKRWQRTFADEAYQARLRQVCPPPAPTLDSIPSRE